MRCVRARRNVVEVVGLVGVGQDAKLGKMREATSQAWLTAEGGSA
jgi:hypothetical protein